MTPERSGRCKRGQLEGRRLTMIVSGTGAAAASAPWQQRCQSPAAAAFAGRVASRSPYSAANGARFLWSWPSQYLGMGWFRVQYLDATERVNKR